MVLVLVVVVVFVGVECWKTWVVTVDSGSIFVGRLDFSGVAMFYSLGAGMFLAAG